jgi:hypothetical protein
MKNILKFQRKTSFKFAAPRANEAPEGVVLLSGLVLTVWLPTILWCSVLNELLPLTLIAVTELIGGIVGLALYTNPPLEPPRCVPLRIAPVVPTDRTPLKLPKAA